MAWDGSLPRMRRWDTHQTLATRGRYRNMSVTYQSSQPLENLGLALVNSPFFNIPVGHFGAILPRFENPGTLSGQYDAIS